MRAGVHLIPMVNSMCLSRSACHPNPYLATLSATKHRGLLRSSQRESWSINQSESLRSYFSQYAYVCELSFIRDADTPSPRWQNVLPSNCRVRIACGCKAMMMTMTKNFGSMPWLAARRIAWIDLSINTLWSWRWSRSDGAVWMMSI